MSPEAGTVSRFVAAVVALTALVTCTTSKPVPADPAKPQVTARAVVPPVEPVSYLNLTPQQALELNAAGPIASTPGPAAKPFLVGQKPSFDRAVECLTAAIYYEAATEPAQGQRAVAQVVLNRVRHPAFPKTVCGVVYQGSERTTGCQFTFTCDGSLVRTPLPELWMRARRVAAAALAGHVEPTVGVATHYHANWVVPYWASSLTRSTAIGGHIFYRWSGFWGTPAAFRGRYAMSEPDIIGRLKAIEMLSAHAVESAAVEATNPRTVESPEHSLPVAAPSLRTLKADLESGNLRDDLNRHQPLAADASGPATLLADQSRASVN
jgi:hypothetical protein